MRKLPLLIVEWDDVTSDSGWRDDSKDFTGRVSHCVSVGWKLKSNHHHIVLTPMRDSFDQCDDRQIIPRGCITNIRRIF